MHLLSIETKVCLLSGALNAIDNYTVSKYGWTQVLIPEHKGIQLAPVYQSEELHAGRRNETFNEAMSDAI